MFFQKKNRKILKDQERLTENIVNKKKVESLTVIETTPLAVATHNETTVIDSNGKK